MSNLIVNPIEQVKAIDTAKPSYGFVSSQNILDVFLSKGWTVEKTQVTPVRDNNKIGYQKHLVWLKNENFGLIPGLSKDNDSIPRLCLVNSHDSSSSLMVFLGVLRIACLNQLSTGSVFRFFRAVHSKNITDRVSQGVDFVTEGIPELIQGIQKLQSIQLNESQRLEFAKIMINMRLETVKTVKSIDYSVVDRFLRGEDRSQDAYTVLNRVQEYVIRGGVPYSYERQVKDLNGTVIETRLVHTKTRRIASIPSQLKLNKALFHNITKIGA